MSEWIIKFFFCGEVQKKMNKIEFIIIIADRSNIPNKQF